ncbi:MAG: Smr protein/MutS2 [Enterovirga sp.]|nr:Smr protein/MutS2 [Enterovirga sp.]
MTRGRARPLTSEDRQIWAEVARSIAPLPGRATPDIRELPPERSEPSGRELPQAAPPPTPPRAKPALAPLAPLEPRTRRALARGKARPDAKLDLHGLREAEAHAELLRFIRRASAEGHKLVLVVTGKGGPAGGFGGGERGVLRRMVPHWLAAPELRSAVLGWEEAAHRQGGAGALHVRLRRGRAAG